MSIPTHVRVAPLVACWAGLLLGACGGGESTSSADSSIPPDTTVVPSAEPVTSPTPVVGELVYSLVPGELREQDLRPDTDGDGIVDAVDPFPAVPAVLSSDSDRLELVRFGALVDDRLVAGRIHADFPLQLEIAGAERFSSALFLRLFAGEADLVVPIEEATGSYQVALEHLNIPFDRVALLSRDTQTTPKTVIYHHASQPMLTQPVVAKQGDVATLSGVLLEQAQVLWQQQALPIAERSERMLRVRIPDDASSGEAHLLGGQGMTASAFQLNVLRQVELQASSILQEAHSGLEYSAHGQRNEWDLRSDESARVLAITERPVVLALHPLDGISGLPLEVILWPDEPAKQVNIDALLEALAFNSARVRALHSGLPWEERRAAIRQWLAAFDSSNPAREQVSAMLRQGPLNPTPLFEGIYQGVANVNVPGATQKFSFEDFLAAPGLTAKEFYGQSIRHIGPNGTATARAQDSSFEIGQVDGLCDGLGGRPSNARTTDLCVRSFNEVSASVAVFSGAGEDRLTFQGHINPRDGVLGPDLLGGTGGFFNLNLNVFGGLGDVGFKRPHTFLKNTSNALCGHSPCQVEIVTGGYGLSDATTLRPDELQIYEVVVARTLLDIIILPIVSELAGPLLDDQSDLKCVTSLAVSALPALQTLVGFMQKAVATVSYPQGEPVVDYDMLASVIQSDLGGVYINLVTGSNGIANCVSSPVDEALEAFRAAVNELVGGGGLVGRIKFAIEKTIALVQFATTRQRVTFQVDPLIKPSLVTPFTLDPTAADLPDLEIAGQFLFELEDTTVNGQPVEQPTDLYPEVILEARTLSGRMTRSYFFEPLTDANRNDPNRRQALEFFQEPNDRSRQSIIIRGATLQSDFFAQTPVSDKMKVILRYHVPASFKFPNNRLDIVAGLIDLVPPPEPIRISPSPLVEGQTGYIEGVNLGGVDLDGAPPLLLLDARTADAEDIVIDNIRADTDPNGVPRLRFQMPLLRNQQRDTVTYFPSVNLRPQNAMAESQEFALPSINAEKADRDSLLDVFDNGQCQDDVFVVELFGPNGAPIEPVEGSGLLMASFLADVTADYAARLSWDSSVLTRNNPDNDVALFRVRCENAGDDCVDETGGAESVCTIEVDYQPFVGTPIRESFTLPPDPGGALGIHMDFVAAP